MMPRAPRMFHRPRPRGRAWIPGVALLTLALQGPPLLAAVAARPVELEWIATDPDRTEALGNLLRGQIALLRAPPGVFDAKRLEEEVRRAERDIATLLETEGYYDARVQGTVTPDLAVVLRVTPGPAATVAAVRIEFTGAVQDPPPGLPWTTTSLRAGWALAPGAVFRHAAWESAKRQLLQPLLLTGYPQARLAATHAVVDATRRGVTLTVTVDSGPLVRLGALQIGGLTRYPARIVAGANSIPAGTIYSQARLLEMGSFEFHVGNAACGLIRAKLSLPAIRNSTVRMVAKRT